MQRAQNNEQADAAVEEYKASHVNPDHNPGLFSSTTNYNGESCLQIDESGACTPVLENGFGSVFGKLLTKTGLVASGAKIGSQGAKILNGVRRKALARAQSTSATQATDDIFRGGARSYRDLTKGSSIRNIGTNATHREFADSLAKGGWSSRRSADEAVQIFQKDGARYVLRNKADSYGGWTADFYRQGSSKITHQLRLGYE